MKPFKTHRQQLKTLRNRGLEIPNGSRAIRILEQENYYSLINGYKDLFLENNPTLTGEKYKEGSTFEDIYKVYLFDRELRNLLLDYLLKFETNVKTRIAYRFSEKYREPHSYLEIKNYTRDPKRTSDVLNLISTMYNEIRRHGKYSNNALNHHIHKHDGVPLWVLVKYLTAGNIQYFYSCLNQSLKNTIAKDLSTTFNNDYKTRIIITPEMLEAIMKTVTYFRNVCAHEERLYSFKIHKPSKNVGISNVLNIQNGMLANGDVFTLVSFLKLVISKKEYKKLLNRLENLFRRNIKDLEGVQFSEVLLEMGFPIDWKNILE